MNGRIAVKALIILTSPYTPCRLPELLVICRTSQSFSLISYRMEFKRHTVRETDADLWSASAGVSSSTQCGRTGVLGVGMGRVRDQY